MATNYKQPGNTMTFTAPTGGVVSGSAYMIGALLVVATSNVAQALPFEGVAVGVFTLPKATGAAWTEGQLLYWDTAAGNLATAASATARRVGCAALAAASGDTTGTVRLHGVPSVVSVA
jgi:predicted RecA/RadA family phage recombinase